MNSKMFIHWLNWNETWVLTSEHRYKYKTNPGTNRVQTFCRYTLCYVTLSNSHLDKNARSMF